jgi:hypothetical protein
MTQHTKGPWTHKPVQAKDSYVHSMIGPESELRDGHGMGAALRRVDDAESAANAALMAAAPELLAALKEMVGAGHMCDWFETLHGADALKQARAAIARATTPAADQARDVEGR